MMGSVFYFGILTIFWGVVWSAIYYVFHSMGKGTSLREFLSCRDHVIALIAVGIMPSAYLLSYPLVHGRVQGGSLMDLYVPVDWFVDHTVMREPILKWAEICNTRRSIESQSASRKRSPEMWGRMPPNLYARFWVAGGAVCFVGPPLLLYWCVRKWQRRMRHQAERRALYES